MFKKIILVCLVFSLISLPLYAAPIISGVSGSFSNSSNITLSGSNFGTKSPAAPLVWDTFEGRTVGANPSNTATVGSWSVVESNGDMHITSSVVYSGSRAVLLDPTGNGRSFVRYSTTSNNSKIYIALKRRYASNVTTNQKFLYLFASGKTSPAPAYSWLDGGIFIVQPDLYGTKWMGASTPVANTWYTEEFEFKWSSGLGASDGIAKYTRNGEVISNYTDVVWRNSSYPAFVEGFYISNYNGEAGYTIYEDDIYFDTTWARVMLGNSASWANCTQREIQIPTAWSDSSITITVNPGSFASGTNVYLFVVDANGNVNTPGYPITVGAGGQPPSAPTGVRIVQ